MINLKFIRKSKICYIVLLGCFFLSCAALLKGTVTALLLEVAPVGLQLFEIPAQLDLKVTNSHPIDVRISNIKYEIYLENNLIVKGEQNLETVIPKKASQVISVPLTVDKEKIPETIKSIIHKRGVKYQVRGAYTVATQNEGNFSVFSLLKPLLRK